MASAINWDSLAFDKSKCFALIEKYKKNIKDNADSHFFNLRLSATDKNTRLKTTFEIFYRSYFKDEGDLNKAWDSLQRENGMEERCFGKPWLDIESAQICMRDAKIKGEQFISLKSDDLGMMADIEEIQLDKKGTKYIDIEESLNKEGIHLVNLPVGDGKTELLVESISQIPEEESCIVITPNTSQVKELHRKLHPYGFVHYHHLGKDPADKKLAYHRFKRMITCAPSLYLLGDETADDMCERHYYDNVRIDEYSQIQSYSNNPDPSRRKALYQIIKMISLSPKSYLLSADMAEKTVIEPLCALGTLYKKNIYRYRNKQNYSIGMNAYFYEDESRLISEVIRRLKKGERGYGCIDFANRKNPLMASLEKIFDKRIEDNKSVWVDSNSKEEGKWQIFKERSLKEVIIELIDKGNLHHQLICSNWAQTSESVVFTDDELERYGFDFTWGIHRGINDPNGVFQAHRRIRQVKTHLIHVKTMGAVPLWEDSWKYLDFPLEAQSYGK